MRGDKPEGFPVRSLVDRYGNFINSNFENINPYGYRYCIFNKPIRNFVFIDYAKTLIFAQYDNIGEEFDDFPIFAIYDIYTLKFMQYNFIKTKAEALQFLSSKLRELTIALTYTTIQNPFKNQKSGIMAGDDDFSPLNAFWEFNPNKPLNGAYKSQNFRAKRYIDAVSNLTDKDRIEKLSAL